MTRIELDRLPEDLARALFEALRLEIHYDRDTNTAIYHITLTGPVPLENSSPLVMQHEPIFGTGPPQE
ncbi:hypothetical protein ALI22I_09385 [Saccharothrix sp. ALI-22-I]|uniref:hypothetical protein n=1 Tax=Saccharothrix sp. ALI-22-I TaxID=1933778 RepID=UPI00097BF3D2|nr:hypothetical protein [Saccharothrix sp. ALI-22-I]ONI91272.1 hypothetical protein ALI22I_09385 [Saccharothrix sp. ALI-22-I]